MEIKLNSEQLAYLKSLDSKKKKRKFLLDCLLGEIESKNIVKFEPIIFKDGVFQTKDKNVADFLSHFCRESKLVEESFLSSQIQDFLSTENILSMNVFEARELIAKSDEVAKLPTDFCVKITDENRLILERIWCEINKETQI